MSDLNSYIQIHFNKSRRPAFILGGNSLMIWYLKYLAIEICSRRFWKMLGVDFDQGSKVIELKR